MRKSLHFVILDRKWGARGAVGLAEPGDAAAVGFGLVGFSSAATSLERRSAIGDAESGGHAVGHAITKWSSYQPDIRRELRYYYVVPCYVGPLTTYSIIQFCDENYLTFVMHAPFRQVFENMPA